MDKTVTVTTLNVRTNGSNLNVRQAPATSAKVITSLKNGASVTVLEKSGVWSLIQAGTVKGYVMSKYLTDAPVVIPAPVATAGVVANLRTGVGVYLREQPSTNAKILGRFVNGQSVYLLGEAKGFYKVNVAGLIGYISKTYVKPILVVNPSPAVPPIAE